MRELADAQVAVVGLGLMGGSLAGALRSKCHCVIGVARRAETVEMAIARGLIDRGTEDLANGVSDADMVILAAPVRMILRLLGELGVLLPDQCCLMDLGSTKARIVAKMEELPRHIQPLGGHPMCGREVAGIEAADPELYQGRAFVLTPLSRTSEAALEMAVTLVEAVGARLLVLDPERHDRLVATISHLPYLLACGLTGTAQAAASGDPLLWDVAASGFRDTSRLAASDVTMMLDILLTNREETLEALGSCQEHLRRLARLIGSADEEGLRALLDQLRDCRSKAFS